MYFYIIYNYVNYVTYVCLFNINKQHIKHVVYLNILFKYVYYSMFNNT